MTDAEPASTPPRFPWTQLAFSAACLGMAAWLWWTCSRCVRVTAADLRAPDAWKRLAGRYVEVIGHPTYVCQLGDGVFLGIIDPDVVLDPDCQGTDGLELAAWICPRDESPPPTKAAKLRSSLVQRQMVLVSPSRMTETHRGRVVLIHDGPRSLWADPQPIVDERMGRFGGEFFAGCAVAAMGLFIFALYLRGWLATKCTQGIRCSA